MTHPLGYYVRNDIPVIQNLEHTYGSFLDELNLAEKTWIAQVLIEDTEYEVGDQYETMREEVGQLRQEFLENLSPDQKISLAIAILNFVQDAPEIRSFHENQNQENSELTTPSIKPIQAYFKPDDCLTDALVAYYGQYLESACLEESAELLRVIAPASGIDFSYVDEPAVLQLAQEICFLEREQLIKTIRGLIWMFDEEQPLTAFANNDWVSTACATFGEKINDVALDDLVYWIFTGCGQLTLGYQFSEEEGTAIEEIRDILDEEYDSYDTFSICKGIADLMHYNFFSQFGQDAA